MKRVCITCASTDGTRLDNGNERWFWRYAIGHFGPFCSMRCVERFDAWPADRRAAKFMPGDVAWHIAHMRETYQGEPAAYDIEWESVEPAYCPAMESFPEIVEVDGKEQRRYPIKGLARSHPTFYEPGEEGQQ